MLILTRRVGQRIFVGEDKDVIISVLSINHKEVRIGITADEKVAVHREEIYERIRNDNAGNK